MSRQVRGPPRLNLERSLHVQTEELESPLTTRSLDVSVPNLSFWTSENAEYTEEISYIPPQDAFSFLVRDHVRWLERYALVNPIPEVEMRPCTAEPPPVIPRPPPVASPVERTLTPTKTRNIRRRRQKAAKQQQARPQTTPSQSIMHLVSPRGGGFSRGLESLGRKDRPASRDISALGLTPLHKTSLPDVHDRSEARLEALHTTRRVMKYPEHCDALRDCTKAMFRHYEKVAKAHSRAYEDRKRVDQIAHDEKLMELHRQFEKDVAKLRESNANEDEEFVISENTFRKLKLFETENKRLTAYISDAKREAEYRNIQLEREVCWFEDKVNKRLQNSQRPLDDHQMAEALADIASMDRESNALVKDIEALEREIKSYLKVQRATESMLFDIVTPIQDAMSSIMTENEAMVTDMTCKHCYGILNNPFTFHPCGHTYCEDCVIEDMTLQDGYRCPQCDKVYYHTPILNMALKDIIELVLPRLETAIAASDSASGLLREAYDMGYRQHYSSSSSEDEQPRKSKNSRGGSQGSKPVSRANSRPPTRPPSGSSGGASLGRSSPGQLPEN